MCYCIQKTACMQTVHKLSVSCTGTGHRGECSIAKRAQAPGTQESAQKQNVHRLSATRTGTRRKDISTSFWKQCHQAVGRLQALAMPWHSIPPVPSMTATTCIASLRWSCKEPGGTAEGPETAFTGLTQRTTTICCKCDPEGGVCRHTPRQLGAHHVSIPMQWRHSTQ